jgi:hypothetical protein
MTCRLALGLVLVAMLGAAAPLQAQESRDPTRAPPELAAAPGDSKPGEAQSGLPLSPGKLSIVVRDGKPQLVWGKRLYQQGQSLGAYKIERISESEVWLRNGKELHKIARFAGIQRRAAAPERSTP